MKLFLPKLQEKNVNDSTFRQAEAQYRYYAIFIFIFVVKYITLFWCWISVLLEEIPECPRKAQINWTVYDIYSPNI